MDFSYFVGKKLAFSKKGSFTALIIKLAIWGIAVSLVVMILSLSIVNGFKKEVSNKVIGFDGHIQIRNLDLNQSKELTLVDQDQDFLETIRSHDNVASVAAFCSKAGIITTGEEVEGILFKGVGTNYNWEFFNKHLKKGRLPLLSDSTDTYEVLLSAHTSNALQLDTGSRFETYFIHDSKVRRRRFDVVGIFNTGLGEFDQSICLTDLRVIQRIYTTDYSKVSGFEVVTNDLTRLTETTTFVDGEIGMRLKAQSIEELHGVIFQWLEIVDSNAVIIITLMLLVAMINMITAFLILVIERTNMIGIVKALGATNWQVAKFFMINALAIIVPGLIIGNLLGFGLAYVQQYFGLIKLDESTYYMSEVPVLLEFDLILMLNAATVALCVLVLFLPALIIRRISPVQAIRFD